MKIKEWLEYRKNKRMVKREMAAIIATTLPFVNKIVNENERVMEILTYIINMSPDDIQKVLVHAVVHSNKELEGK